MSIDWKSETRKQWNANPCGTGEFLADVEPETLAWFDKLRRERYTGDHWMPRVIPFDGFAGKMLLEVGHGIGSDLLSFAEGGAIVHGIDITDEHHRLCRLNFELHGRPVELKLCDAAKIDYPDATFDVVYSHGVLHHTPDIEACIAEVHRVLKPGGTFILSMYHTWSAFHLFAKVLFDGILGLRLFRLGYRGLMATLERGADGVTIRPLVHTYSTRQVRQLLERFDIASIEVAHLYPSHFGFFGRFIPERISRRLESRLGWYVVAQAIKRL